ncbi:ATP-dependent DNA helicase RecG [Clostridium sp. SYSU_GA19001]|uniref:ATP-dependent DNA helicase RecG n=1 Tax=Clostridium caldaquaticum TaxID=2940653 RepID=UPI00207700A0|nr:ATP-dependent DNA helicase RecG [Clostridium caldaquaticum]MCM8710582.1 ATP-dependent DNA helicase RecG [Clostridium caldaquaticum]
MDLYSEISYIKGIGPKMKELLNNCGINNVIDLLLYFPRDYEKILLDKNLDSTKDGNKVVINCTVIKIDRDVRTKTKRVISTVVFKYNNGIIKGKWFNQPYMKEKFVLRKQYTISGKIQSFKGERMLINPTIINNKDNIIMNSSIQYLSDKNENAGYKLVPKYPLREGLTNNFLIKIISETLKCITISENLPIWLIKKYEFCSLDKAIRNIHNPESNEALLKARKRLKFQELFIFSLKMIMLKDFINNSRGIAFSISPDLKVLKEQLPFNLTNSQSRVIREILLDEKKNKQMNRLVQGDVGSGKTIVAIISMFNVVKNGYQAALLAPTEILANQHYLETQQILKSFNINISLLTGSVSQKQKEIIKSELKEGNIDIIVGTHALLEENVEFKNLGIVVTDELHRFGVIQRSMLFNKGKNVDILVMTATPIPRTLSLYLYGDLDVSIIDELPPGRQKIETFYVEHNKKDKVYKFAAEEIKKGRQAYVVCPLVEENDELSINSVEKLYRDLVNNYFKEEEISILHGKMANKTKDEIMNKFKNGEIKILVSTTVIEVGINVPNATVMIIENAERFGLAQLHQLRGRVGRGSFKSYCILIANIKNDIVEKRLQILKNSNDGFQIAEEDLKIRGSGELFGVRQHGESNFILSDLINDIELLKAANAEAKKLLKSQKEEDIKFKNEIIKKIEQTSQFICFN